MQISKRKNQNLSAEADYISKFKIITVSRIQNVKSIYQPGGTRRRRASVQIHPPLADLFGRAIKPLFVLAHPVIPSVYTSPTARRGGQHYCG